MRPLDAGGNVVLDNVTVVGSALAGMRYLSERCGDGVAIGSAYRAAATLAGSGASATGPAGPKAGRRRRATQAEVRS
jgi:anaerobic glycerol-3-phosphate dehydrogenase